MDKPFRSIDEQIELLQSRGIETDEKTGSILLREGYYQIINGYKDPFINKDVTKKSRKTCSTVPLLTLLPKQPANPEKPEQPANPEEPEKSEKPKQPANPEKPEKPEKPESPPTNPRPTPPASSGSQKRGLHELWRKCDSQQETEKNSKTSSKKTSFKLT
ncbi:MAG: hypothetical protein IJ125_00530 [Atopobiaceae bacterium]|nr:hypothetical protein [Atopobiaceae bacterium]